MSRSCRFPYIGIDGCRSGWFYVGLDDESFEVGVIGHIDAISPWIESATLILVDIPIGLPSKEIPNRLCDVAARRMITPRGSTVFPAPSRSAISKSTYEEGSEENLRSIGRRLSKQTWAISPKIKEVDEFLLTARPGRKVREMHPEVAFCGLNGGEPVLSSKKQQHGFSERFELLKRYFPRVGAVFDAARKNTPPKAELQDDDILDALVGAVTASHCPNVHTLPENPIVDAAGLPMEIVYAAGT